MLIDCLECEKEEKELMDASVWECLCVQVAEEWIKKKTLENALNRTIKTANNKLDLVSVIFIKKKKTICFS